MTYLDTHIVVHLAAGDAAWLSPAARQAIEAEQLLISPAVVLELQLLHEIGLLKLTASRLAALLEHDLGVRICQQPFHRVAAAALGESWTRDPFDRLIVANAKSAHAPLVTKDTAIRRHYPASVW